MSHNCRLYLITPPEIEDLTAFSESLKSALGAGDVACLQLRLKNREEKNQEEPLAADRVQRAAETLLPIARAHDVAFLINDDPDLAVKTGADGVHIGQGDMPYEHARRMLGDDATIGVTCHNSRHLAMTAGEAGADYVAFGAFFPTVTKNAATRAEPSLLEWWNFATIVPSVAIGGITPDNCAALVRAHADFLAVSHAVWSHENGPAAAVAEFLRAIRDA